MGKWAALIALAVMLSGCVVRDGPYRPHYRSGPVYIERYPDHRHYHRPAPPHYRHGPPRERRHWH